MYKHLKTAFKCTKILIETKGKHVYVCSVAPPCLVLCSPIDCRSFLPYSGTNTRVGCHFLFQGIFLIQGSNPCLLRLLYWQADSLPLSHLGSPTGKNKSK